MTHGVRRRLVAALAAGALLTGCGASAGEIGPSGVDGLQVPTPTPDPADFVTQVDHPLLPLAPGTVWTYDVLDARGEQVGVVTVSVATGPHEVAGVETTAVSTVRRGPGGGVRAQRDEWFAQDRSGNVWQFGRTGDEGWEAGVSGAEAGLAMPADPRTGDGYRPGFASGTFEQVVTVLALAARVQIPAGTWDDALHTEISSGLDPQVRIQRFHVPGVGLVVERDLRTGRVLELRSTTRP